MPKSHCYTGIFLKNVHFKPQCYTSIISTFFYPNCALFSGGAFGKSGGGLFNKTCFNKFKIHNRLSDKKVKISFRYCRHDLRNILTEGIFPILGEGVLSSKNLENIDGTEWSRSKENIPTLYYLAAFGTTKIPKWGVRRYDDSSVVWVHPYVGNYPRQCHSPILSRVLGVQKSLVSLVHGGVLKSPIQTHSIKSKIQKNQ